MGFYECPNIATRFGPHLLECGTCVSPGVERSLSSATSCKMQIRLAGAVNVAESLYQSLRPLPHPRPLPRRYDIARAADHPLRIRPSANKYLTPQEEKALEAHILRCHRNGHPLQVKDLPFLAAVIVRQRSSIFQLPAADQDVHPPTKTWT